MPAKQSCTFTAIALAAAFAASAAGAPQARAADDTYDLNVIIPLTGGGAFLGKAEQESLNVAEKTLNAAGGIHGKKIRLVFHDDQSTPQVAVQLTNQVVATHPAV